MYMLAGGFNLRVAPDKRSYRHRDGRPESQKKGVRQIVKKIEVWRTLKHPKTKHRYTSLSQVTQNVTIQTTYKKKF